MAPLRQLVRTAKRLCKVWPVNQGPPHFEPRAVLEPLDDHLEAIRQVADQIEKAERRNFSLIMPQLFARLDRKLRALEEFVPRLRLAVVPEPVSRIDGSTCLAELQQIEAEFGAMTLDWERKVLAVVTDAITLKDIDLGPFAIEFHWSRWESRTGVACFDIVALVPNPAASNSDVTHPHVRDQVLCAGEARNPIADALDQGRLADAFVLIRSVLSNYNPASPYVALSEWEGNRCADCGQFVGQEDGSACARCGEEYCDDCMSYCAACEESRCPGCLQSCDRCRADCCRSCLKACATSGRRCCPKCLRPCRACQNRVAIDKIAADTGLCPKCSCASTNGTDASVTDSVPHQSNTLQEDFLEASIPSGPPVGLSATDLCAPGVAEAPVPLSSG